MYSKTIDRVVCLAVLFNTLMVPKWVSSCLILGDEALPACIELLASQLPMTRALVEGGHCKHPTRGL